MLLSQLPWDGKILTEDIATVKPPIKDPLKKGQPLNNGHISGHQNYACSTCFSASERGQPLYKRHNLCPQCIRCSDHCICTIMPGIVLHELLELL